MGLRFLEHVLILTHDPQATRDWFVANLGFREGPHPDFGFPVHWLYIGEQDVIHIGKARHSPHQDTYLKAPSERKAHGSNLYQLFMREPVNGIKIELNFAWHEAARIGRVPEWTDAGATGTPAGQALRP
jgi:catechol 2,3-dioxygenase-like lactoylglutathione lyase family enzyme